MENPNRMALDLVDEAIDFADELNVGVSHLANDAAVLDFGVHRRGGVEAGLLLAEVATGGLATVQARLQDVRGAALTAVELSTDHPRRSLLACQSPGWSLDDDGETVRASGPARLLRDGGSGDDDLGFDEADFAVLVVESGREPGEDLVETVAAEAGVPPGGVFVLVAPATSVAGGVAAAARAAERAVTRYVGAGHDPDAVRSVTAVAPVATLAADPADARARGAAAIAYGGRVHLVVESAPDRPERLIHRGSETRTAAGADGPAEGGDGRSDRLLDESDDLPAPAQVTVDVVGGPTHVVGEVDEAAVAAGLELGTPDP